MYQKTTVLGRLANYPELNYLTDGLAVTTFRLAVENNRQDGDGNVTKETTWFKVYVFGRPAEMCDQHLTKGSLVLVEGKLKTDPITGNPRIFERKDGTIGTSFELTAEKVTFVDE